MKYKALAFVFVFPFCAPAAAQDIAPLPGFYANAPSSNIYGAVGLNTIPSARMDTAGTIKLGVSTLDPYAHGFLGFQLSDAINVTLRQTAEASSLRSIDPTRMYPGVDLKLRLLTETRSRPEIALGLQSAVGHKRMAGEYIAASKRWNDFDFTAGLGWGRMGTAKHFKNPLKTLGEHFGGRRDLNGDMPNAPDDWFTGEDVGIFAGVEYFTPLENLSLKFDYGADRYTAEKTISDFQAPAPWSVGLSYQPAHWINLSLAAQGTDKLMARLTLKTLLDKIKNKGEYGDKKPHMRAYRTNLAETQYMEMNAREDGITLQNTAQDGFYTTTADLSLNPGMSAPEQIGRAAVHMSNHAGPAAEQFILHPAVMGLRGPEVKLLRADIERAVAFHTGSPEEIWRNAEFSTNYDAPKRNRANEEDSFFLTLDQQLSLAEEDSGALTRTSIVGGYRGARIFGLFDQGHALRLNLHDNLERLTEIRPRDGNPARGDVDLFAERRAALEHSYFAYTHSLNPELHLSLIGGYLEEMYAGAGGEILWRPFGSRLALGAEIWDAAKRNPDTALNLGFTGESVLSGHANLWYDLPRLDLTLHAKAGRYLAGDIGGTIALARNFKNGMSLEGFITLTDNADYDIFGGSTHAHHGLRLNVPIGGYKYVPENTGVKFRAEPFGRDTGQVLNNPLPLYRLTEPFSYTHLAQHWGEVVE